MKKKDIKEKLLRDTDERLSNKRREKETKEKQHLAEINRIDDDIALLEMQKAAYDTIKE